MSIARLKNIFLALLISFLPLSSLADFIPNDPLFYKQEYLKALGAQKFWDLSLGEGSIIAFIDSGIQITHPDLRENIWVNIGEIPYDNIDNDNNGYIDDTHGWDFLENVPDPGPKFSQACIEDGICNEEGINHGTIVAGIAAARGQNEIGIIGIAPKAKIMTLRALDSSGKGDVSGVLRAINYAIRKDADIINLSLVGSYNDERLANAIKKASAKGILVVAASGNENIDLDNTPLYPICMDNGANAVLGISGLKTNGDKLEISNFGKKCVDLSALGENFYSSISYNKENPTLYYEGYFSGTSLATSVVSGAAALLKSIKPSISNKEMSEILKNKNANFENLSPEYKGKMGDGELNILSALRELKPNNQAAKKQNNKTVYILTAPKNNFSTEIKIYNSRGDYLRSINAYDKNLPGGINLISSDVTGGGKKEIIVGAGRGGGPHIRIFDRLGRLQSQFFAYDKNFRGGVNVGSGDLTGDDISEILTGPGPGMEPIVKVLDFDGSIIFSFLAYDKNFRGGVKVAVGDIDGDGQNEIITGAGGGGGPHIRIFDRFGRLQSQFFAYDKNFRGGVNISLSDIDNDGIDDIITGAGGGGGPHIRAFNAQGKGKVNFFAFDKNLRNGVQVGSADINGDGKTEIITASGEEAEPIIKIFNTKGELLDNFNIYSPKLTGGVNIAAMEIN